MLKKLLLSSTLLCFIGYSSTAIAGWDKSIPADLSNLSSQKALSFTENKGQLLTKKGKQNRQILYKANAKGVNLYLTRNGLSYLFTQKIGDNKLHDKHEKLREKELIAYHRIAMHMQGANAACEVINELPVTNYQNYYLGKTTVGSVLSYQKVTYKNIYPNIDWVVYAQHDEIKYDFIVHPGGDPSRIKLVYQDQNNLQLTEGHDLQLDSYLGKIVEQKPFTYQGNKQEITSSYNLKKNIVSFTIGNYNKQHDLVIDPGIVWSTYFGGTNGETGIDTKADLNGDVYFAGATSSVDILMDTSFYAAVDTFAGGSSDCFVSKFDAQGQLLWASYYGGVDAEGASAITVTPDNKLILLGSSWGNDLYMVNGFQSVSNGGTDAFLVQFDQNGFIERSSYFGSFGFEPAWSVTCDYSGNIYFTGSTSSVNGIAFGSGFDQTHDGGWDGYIVKIDNSWTPQWGTYFGGPSDDEIYGISLEPDSAFIFTTGYTESSSGIVYNFSAPSSYAGLKDAFVSKHDFNGNLLTACYHGGPGDDQGNDIDCEPNFLHIVSIVGTTNSTTGIATSNQIALGGGTDAFVVDFRNDLTYIHATYFGGPGNELGNDIVDHGGSLFICGRTESSSGISTSSSFQPTFGLGQDGFIAGFVWWGMTPFYATYFGSGGFDQLFGIDQQYSYLYVAGESSSFDNMCYGNSYQNTNFNPSNSWTGLLAKFPETCLSTPNPITISTSTGTNQFCAGNGLILNASGANNFQWTGGPSGNSYSISTGGTYEVIGSRYGCSFSQQITISSNAIPSVTVSPSGAQYVCEHDSMLLTANSATAISYQWYLDGLPLSGQTNPGIYAHNQGTYTVEVKNAFDCSKISFPVQLFVNSAPPAVISTSGSTDICQGSSLLLTANNAAVSYQWLLNGNSISGATGNSYNASTSGNYSVREVSPNTCDSVSNEISVTVHAYPSASINYSGLPYNCLGNTVTLNAVTDIGNSYQWQLNSTNINGETNPTFAAAAGGNYSVVVTGPGNCATTSSIIELNPQPIPSNICFASIDTAFNQTVVKVAWEKPAQAFVKAYVIYREFAGQGFVPIDTVSNTLFSSYIDTTASPETNVEAYKVTTLDSCNAMSDISLALTHKTILLQGALDFGQTYIGWDWEPYFGVNDPTRFYRIMRDKNGTGQWDSIAATPWSVTAWNDTAINYPNARYAIDLVWAGNCNPSQRVMAGFNTTRSNIKNRISIPVGVLNNTLSNNIKLFPNPAREEFNITGLPSGMGVLEISDVTGRVVLKQGFESKNAPLTFSISDLPKGVYAIHVKTKEIRFIKKLLVE